MSSTVDDGMRRAVLRRLAALDQAAEQTNAGGALAPLARAELQRLADGWRLLLEVHTADDEGRCRACPGRLRKRRWPCKVWLLAHQHLIGAGTEPPPPQRGGVLGLFKRGGRHSKHANNSPVQGVRTPPLPVTARRSMEIPPEVPSEMTVRLPVVRAALPPAPTYTPITPASPPPAIASSGPFAIVDDPTWPAPSEYLDRPDAPALASLDPIGAFGGVLPPLPPRQSPPPVHPEPAAPPTEPLEDTMVSAEITAFSPRFELLGEPDAETEEMRRVLEHYWQESPAAQ